MVPRPGSILILALPLLLEVAPASATASLICTAEDRNMSFSLLGNIGSGDGASIQAIEGAIKLKAVRGKFDAVEFKIEPGRIAEHWSFGKELRIGISPEEVDGVSVYLAIIAEKAKGNDDAPSYRGGYVLKVRGAKGESELKGKLKGCDAG